jgi:hypothetical protein
MTMDSRDRLRRDQEKLNRMREDQAYDRRHAINTLRSGARINELTHRIDAAERKRRSDEAFERMWEQWPKTREAIERCASVAPDVQKKWLDRLEAIKNSGRESAAEQLSELEREIERLTDVLLQASADLRKAADSRRSFGLRQIVQDPVFPTQTPRAGRRHQPFQVPDVPSRNVLTGGLFRGLDSRRSALAPDLQPIHDLILRTFALHQKLRFAWMDQLEQIDRQGRGLTPSPAEKTEATAEVVKLAMSDLRLVGSTVGLQAAMCRAFWEA